MSRCKHREGRIDHCYMVVVVDGNEVFRRVDINRCLNCGKYLSLGPANVTPKVAIEIRAAELAGINAGMMQWERWERFGWYDNGVDARLADDVEARDADAWLAGWLAREIATTP